jgi:hypothetical protein
MHIALRTTNQLWSFTLFWNLRNRHIPRNISSLGREMYLIGMPVDFAAENIVSEESVAALVDRFYSRVRQDEILGPVFAENRQRVGASSCNHARFLVVIDAGEWTL